ncbi:MAG: nuclear transport factor 2 family protein [Alphaproteobacteria bacterium]|nr:nuclear transport factor 2 family protein [Alphaproteobacteria bacterium]MBU1514602.1 nuclear transport factor 2 family protein [Alphaproteobacteria bacterium]MBU2096766.1 nuclear transport factor 2 family protein [Alphaproteobacteria bacterium]MBU2150398.1 nuclear transport factor 2 family protein [Alphaproteobacteria bacterium]MBU2306601.1 nuclear transport factor 2 family protein [Alphaproteobacteria bacterium]
MSDPALSPLDTVKAFMRAMETKNYDAAMPLVADDCEYENIPMAKVRGPAAVRAVLEPFFAPVIENQFVITRFAVNGSVVFMERLDRHRLADRWVELPVTGVWEVRDGRIAVWRDYFDVGMLVTRWPELQAAMAAA